MEAGRSQASRRHGAPPTKVDPESGWCVVANQRPGAVAQAALREERWHQVETTWGMLSDAEVANLAPASRGGLIGVQRPEGLRYPEFQLFFDAPDGDRAVAPAWTRLCALLAPAGWSDADMLAWTSAPNAWLEGRSPAQEIQDHPAEVTEALHEAVLQALPPS